jgi:hypothetical protein
LHRRNRVMSGLPGARPPPRQKGFGISGAVAASAGLELSVRPRGRRRRVRDRRADPVPSEDG